MPEPSIVRDLEEKISRLSTEEQFQLIERVSHRIQAVNTSNKVIDSQLREMAADPEIQKELREIESEFYHTEGDGLNV
ncbi:MAG: hypothetical protein OXU79_13500 [Gemmatimonadota bacterium]|nr:hypothetical protein [Gemmatimonadota bacterium]